MLLFFFLFLFKMKLNENLEKKKLSTDLQNQQVRNEYNQPYVVSN